MTSDQTTVVDPLDITISPTFCKVAGYYQDAERYTSGLDALRTLTNEDESPELWKRLGWFAAKYADLAGVGRSEGLKLIAIERARQIAKFGDQTARPDQDWFEILMEEVGEASREKCELMDWNRKVNKTLQGLGGDTRDEAEATLARRRDQHMADFKKECLEVSAVAFAWADAILRRAGRR
jgi:hypothetical protein